MQLKRARLPWMAVATSENSALSFSLRECQENVFSVGNEYRNFNKLLLHLQNRCIQGCYLLIWLLLKWTVAMMKILLFYHLCMSLSCSCTYLLNQVLCLVLVLCVRSCLGWEGVNFIVGHVN